MQKKIYIYIYKGIQMQTSLTLRAAPPLESPSSLVKMAPVIPISRLNVVTKAVDLPKEKVSMK